jgi:hypothetical protein
MARRRTAHAAWWVGQAGCGACCLGAILMPESPDPDLTNQACTAALLVLGALALLGSGAASGSDAGRTNLGQSKPASR